MDDQLLLKSIPVLNTPSVFIKNRVEVERKLLILVQGGVNKLQIITDFDETITKQKPKYGESTLTSVDILHACPSLPESYKILSNTLYKKYHLCECDKALEKKTKAALHDMYHPCACDNLLDKTVKESRMLKWWKEEGTILKNICLPEQEFEDVVQNSSHRIRKNTFEMLNYANNYNIPVLIFSAGVGNAIVAILKVNGMMFQNITILSNFLKYKAECVINGFQSPIIHVLNKNDCILKYSNYYSNFRERCNILLLGDNVGDTKMTVDNTDRTILRIGFIKENDKSTVEFHSFCNQFDILLIDDQSMNVPFDLLKIIPKI